MWAITEFRTFVTEHLKPWHKFCEDNYLYDWKSAYDVKPELKRMRTYTDSEELPLPSWVQLLSDPVQRKVQARAKRSLAEALEKHRRRKGKGRRKTDTRLVCYVGECSTSQEIYVRSL
jgi:hypothetical protein